MENEIKVNEFVRSNQGIFIISHINIKFDNNDYRKVCLCQNEKVAFTSIDNIKKLKHSPNLIDLICEGDYVNGELVEKIETGLDWGREITTTTEYLTNEEDIKTVVTKEMMESISYKVKTD